MRKLFLIVFCLTGLSAFAPAKLAAQKGELAPGAIENFQALLDKPAFVQPTKAVAMGKSWFKMETDAHVFTGEVSVRQVAAVLLDLDNQSKYFQGRKNKLNATVVQKNPGETIVDFVTITPALGIQVKTPYKAAVKTLQNSETVISTEIRQLDSDNASNNHLKNLLTIRYAQAVAIDGKDYTYIRLYSRQEANASVLPGARGILENTADAANIESLQLLITAAKTK